jgi:hypothetical protein
MRSGFVPDATATATNSRVGTTRVRTSRMTKVRDMESSEIAEDEATEA